MAHAIERVPSARGGVRVPGTVFDALFRRGLRAEGRLALALAEHGYDVRRPEREYPVGVWQGCITATRHVLCAHLDEAASQRLLGRKLAEGLLRTLLGRMVMGAVPALGAARLLDHLPRHAGLFGRSERELRIVPDGVRARRARFEDPFNHPAFAAGALETGLREARVEPVITVLEWTGGGYTLHIRW